MSFLRELNALRFCVGLDRSTKPNVSLGEKKINIYCLVIMMVNRRILMILRVLVRVNLEVTCRLERWVQT